jgi:hypothetical protein
LNFLNIFELNTFFGHMFYSGCYTLAVVTLSSSIRSINRDAFKGHPS